MMGGTLVMKKFKEQGTGTVRWANGDTIKQKLTFY